MNCLAIRAVHDPALGKAKSLLIKAHSSRYVGDGEHSRYGVLLLVEWINFLLSHGAPFSKTNILANTRGRCICSFHTATVTDLKDLALAYFNGVQFEPDREQIVQASI